MPDDSAAELAEVFAAAISAGDEGAMDALCDPEAELWPYLARLTGQPFRGASALSDWYREASKTFSEIELELIRVTGLENGAVAICRSRQRERNSGLVLDQQVAIALRAPQDKLIWVQTCPTEKEARAALA